MRIKEKHLIAVRAYCEFDTLQCKFSETFRRTDDNQTMKDVIKRHSNYHHFARYLKEAIQVFGISYGVSGTWIGGKYQYSL